MQNVAIRRSSFVLAVSLASLVPTGLLAWEHAARADIPPPNMTCGNKKPGDSCVDDSKKSGTCAAQRCNRVSMAAGPNGTMEQKNVEYDCTLCVVGNGPTPATSGTPASPSEKKGCNASGAGTGDAAFLVLAALGLLVRSRRAA